MHAKRTSAAALISAALVFFAAVAATRAPQTPAQPPAVQIDDKSIGGVVTSRFGPEAEGIDAPAPGAPGATPETLSSPLVVEFQLRPDPLAH